MRTLWLNEQIRVAKVKAQLKGKQSLEADQILLVAGDEAKYLEDAYKEAKFSKPKNLVGLTKSLPPEDMKKLMLANAPVEAGDVARLAAARAKAVEVYLSNAANAVDRARLFIVADAAADANVATPKDAKPTRVDFALK